MAKLLSGPSCNRVVHLRKKTSVATDLGCRSASPSRANSFSAGKTATQLSWRPAVGVSAPRRARLDIIYGQLNYLEQQQQMPQQQQVRKLTRRTCSIAPPSGALRLSILTFNVLADGLAQEGGFIRAPPEALLWQHRRGLLLAEIQTADADIICLQECNHFEDFFQPELAQLGYVGQFSPKLQSPAQQYGCSADGSALFYRSARLSAVSPPESVAFKAGNGKDAAQGMLRWRLHDRLAGRQLLVATLHLKAKPGTTNDQIRCSQAQQAVAVLAAESAAASAAQASSRSNGSGPAAAADAQVLGDARASGSDSRGSGNGSHAPEQQSGTCLPVLLCGDMNAEPDSLACEALRGHALGLRSVWDARLAEPGEEEALLTTWKFRADGETQRVIDYIWLDVLDASRTKTNMLSAGACRHTAELQPVARWRTPSAAELGSDGLPSMAYPSDHLACFSTMQWG